MNESGREETVKSLICPDIHRRQGAKITLRRDELALPRDICRRQGHSTKARIALQKGLNLLFAFLGLERTSAINERATGRDELRRMSQETLLQLHQSSKLLLAPDKG